MSSNSITTNRDSYTIENRNFLSPIGFKFSIARLRGVDFFCNSATIPAISMGTYNQPTRFNKVPQPGDELNYEEFRLRFLVDENMKNWYQVHDWMREIATPYSSREFGLKRRELESRNPKNSGREGDNQWKCDCSLFVLSNNHRAVAEFVFRDAFPTSLATLNFDATSASIEYLTADLTMQYSRYDYLIHKAATATDEDMKPTYQLSEQGVDIFNPKES